MSAAITSNVHESVLPALWYLAFRKCVPLATHAVKFTAPSLIFNAKTCQEIDSYIQDMQGRATEPTCAIFSCTLVQKTEETEVHYLFKRTSPSDKVEVKIFCD